MKTQYSSGWVVYKATNSINGKQYIGLTKHNLKERQGGHYKDANRQSQCHFHRAFRKYGKDAFIWTIMYECNSQNAASIVEQQLIKHFDSYNDGYNMTTGGEAGWSRKASDETRKKIADIRRGTKRTIASRQKQSITMSGRLKTTDHRKKLSEANKRRWASGQKIGRTGYPCSVDGRIFSNQVKAAHHFGVTTVTIRKWLKSGKHGAIRI